MFVEMFVALSKSGHSATANRTTNMFVEMFVANRTTNILNVAYHHS
uniref:(California timema) hypothetical protein n=1 Tax=Timema californicum TaxID=61474 RepID=A0A7R9PFK6_TIMCA|nr:unnamed protein product [Timema californicum]